MRRTLVILGGAYLTAAAVGHVAEQTGRTRCDCRPECWCKRPGLSLFRWVFPVGHSIDCH